VTNFLKIERRLPNIIFLLLSLLVLLYPVQSRGTEETKLTAEVRQQAAEEGSVRALVKLDLPLQPESRLSVQQRNSQRRGIQRAQEKVAAKVDENGGRVKQRLQSSSLMAVEVDEAGLEKLSRLELVESVSKEPVLNIQAEASLGTSGPHIGAADLHDTATGEDQIIAVLDTGIDTHPAFDERERIVGEACFLSANDGQCPNGDTEQFGPGSGIDFEGHGTHVAGIAAGQFVGADELENSNDDLDTGVAPGADLLAVTVLNEEGDGKFTDIFKGLEWVADKASDSSVVAANLSLGDGEKYTSYCDNITVEGEAAKGVFDNLIEAGVVPVVASGNEGHSDGVSFPACLSNTVAVGATKNYLNEEITSFSNQHPEMVSLVAPGNNIRAAKPQNSAGQKSGTSMSAPHLAGGLALLSDALEEQAPEEIIAAMRTSGKRVVDDRAGGASYSSIRLLRAYNYLVGLEEEFDEEDKFFIVPNPYRPHDDSARTGSVAHGINFVKLPEDFELTVYSLTGEEVVSRRKRNSGGSWEWYPVEAGSGTYFVVVKDLATGRLEKRKLGIVK